MFQNKRGQFFLIAALVIVLIMVSLTTVYTSIKVSKEDSSTYDLSKEISSESAQVIDNGVYTGNIAEIETRIENLTDYYSLKNPNQEILLIYGNPEEDLTILSYNQTSTGEVSVSTGGRKISQNFQKIKKIKSSIGLNGRDSIEVKVSKDITREFKIKQGQNLYILIGREKNGEKTLISN